MRFFKFKIDRRKLRLFWLWLIGWFGWGKDLATPIKCRKISQKKKSLLGKAYYFSNLKGWKITSPLSGVIHKIYPNYALQIINEHGLQILLDIQVNEKKMQPLDKILQCEVQVGQKVNSRAVLFIIYLVEYVNCVVVYVPWQPEILRKVGELEIYNQNKFTQIYYRNPYLKIKLKRHGEY
ncbi:MAG: hypothetical protein MRERC_14c014 [Mycoplasmataceae bacterium RC_NB112A]|nr:MAG: hypothetical protein MRERC_14c014 [Mycoplasmataceae bacterium RC_NB112A]